MSNHSPIQCCVPEEAAVFQLFGSDGNMMVRIRADGGIEFGPNYTPDEAARIFWATILVTWNVLRSKSGEGMTP